MSVKFTSEIFISESIKIHRDKYDYSLVDYNKSSEKVIINCKKHGDFTQRAKNHLEGQGCPRCGEFFGIKERQARIGKYIVDGFDPLTNTIYEFNVDFWHGNPDLYNENDINNVLNKTFGELYKKNNR